MTKPQPVTREEHFRLLNEWNQSPDWIARCVYDFQALIGKKWEITEEVYWEFLEVLPPVNWRGIESDLETFYMSEALSGNIRSMYSRHGSRDNARYYHEWAEYPKAVKHGR